MAQIENTQKAKESLTPTLDQFSRDLTELAKIGKLDPVIGRDQEIESMIQTLIRKSKNNPVLIGPPGVGKTALAEGLAILIAGPYVPKFLKGKRVLSLDINAMIAGTKFRGEFEERIKAIVKEAKSNPDIILFIDELHTIMGAGSAKGSLDVANILKPELARGLQIIGATTTDEYRQHIEKDPALARRFQRIVINPPTSEETIQILKGLRSKYEAHHGVTISDEAIVACVKLSDRYLSDRFQPDKAIDLMDEGASRINIYKERYKKPDGSLVLESTHIEELVNHITGIPVSKPDVATSAKLISLEEDMSREIIGQKDAVSAIARAMRRASMGFRDTKRPIASFLFTGPTGVGKTHTAKVLAEKYFGKSDNLVRIDMSEYMDKHTVSRLIGAPPGYAGYDQAGQLTEQVRRQPYSVVLFDEVEKAHPDVLNVLLQILEDGRLTDNRGNVVDFNNCVIIMTSNLGAKPLAEATIGFTRDSKNNLTNHNSDDSRILSAVNKFFRPEIVNRMDEIIIFRPFEQDSMMQLLGTELKKFFTKTKNSQIEVTITDSAKEFLVQKGYDKDFGARPLRRTIERDLEDPLAELILAKKVSPGDKVIADEHEGRIQYFTEKDYLDKKALQFKLAA